MTPRFARRAFQQRLGATRRSRALIAVRGGYGSVAAAAAARSGRDPAHAQGVHRLQRQHVAPLVAHQRVRRRVVPRSDARGPPRARGEAATIATSFDARADARGAGRTLTHPAARDAASRRSRGHAGRRHADPTRWRRSARHSRSIRRAGHVLFIDEVGERPYRLDRMLTQLRLAGLLARAAGRRVRRAAAVRRAGDGGPRARAVVARSAVGLSAGRCCSGCPRATPTAPA